MSLDRNTVVAALRAEDVAAHLGIPGQWRGRWLRSTRCGIADHGSEAFGLSRDGMWHCHACDQGGDLLKLIALSEKLDLRADFPKILEVAAGIAGVEDDEAFGAAARPPPKVRPPLPDVLPLSERITRAKARASWTWGRLLQRKDVHYSVADGYLKSRGLDPFELRKHEDIRETPIRCTMQEIATSDQLKSMSYLFGAPGVAIPVRCAMTDQLVDIRVRRAEPRPDQPKIVGMLGGVTDGAAGEGRPRSLVGCYGYPAIIDTDLVVVVEGLMDYLTAIQLWPGATVLGAVHAGQMGVVAAHAASHLARRDGDSRMIVVEQNDADGVRKDGTTRIGAADASINEDPNAAAKMAMRHLGPGRVGWLLCEGENQLGPVKDLNDLFRGQVNPATLVRWDDPR